MGNRIKVTFRGDSKLAEAIKTNANELTQEEIEECFLRPEIMDMMAKLRTQCKIPDEVFDHGDIHDLVGKLDYPEYHERLAALANLAFETDAFKVVVE